jgi:hypothetical protein
VEESDMTDEAHRVKTYLVGWQTRAYCTKPGCPWLWDGIGVLALVRAEHERLNEEP